MLLKKIFTFDAAHHLTKYHGKCERPHGHTYKLVVTLEGEPDGEDMVYDFVKLKKLVHELVLDHYDHADLNDIFENPTAENIAVAIYNTLAPAVTTDLVRLREVEVWETATSGVVYGGQR